MDIKAFLLSNKKVLAIIFLVLFALALPVTIFVLNRSQEARSRASATTSLYFEPSTVNLSTQCAEQSINLMVNPGTGDNANIVSIVDFFLTYDASKIDILSVQPSSDFPQVSRAVNISPGSVDMSVSVGSDVTKAVRAPAKVATIFFKPKSTGTASLTIDSSKTRVFSLAVQDQPTENVLYTASPGSINVISGSCSGNDSLTPSPTSAPTLSPILTPDQTITPSVLTPTPTCTPRPACLDAEPRCLPPEPIGGYCTPSPTPRPMSLEFSVGITGIGIATESGQNNSPKHLTRSISVHLFDTLNHEFQATADAMFNPNNATFEGHLDLPYSSDPGPYVIKLVDINNTLVKQVPGIYYLPYHSSALLPAVQLTPGDVNGDNQIDLLDYNIFLSCIGEKTCGQKDLSDFNDDGVVDEVDFNILYSGFAKRQGD